MEGSVWGQTNELGGSALVLCERYGVHSIRVNGRELMSGRVHGSEEDLESLGLARVRMKVRDVLAGWLGTGFTLRSVLEAVPGAAEVVVAEILPAVVEWNRGPSSSSHGGRSTTPGSESRFVTSPR